jgi:hypothetical protein
MAETPSKVMVPIRVPLYAQGANGEDLVEVGVIEATVGVTIEPSGPPRITLPEPDRAPWDPQA